MNPVARAVNSEEESEAEGGGLKWNEEQRSRATTTGLEDNN